jgi:hypothetical protein
MISEILHKATVTRNPLMWPRSPPMSPPPEPSQRVPNGALNLDAITVMNLRGPADAPHRLQKARLLLQDDLVKVKLRAEDRKKNGGMITRPDDSDLWNSSEYLVRLTEHSPRLCKPRRFHKPPFGNRQSGNASLCHIVMSLLPSLLSLD